MYPTIFCPSAYVILISCLHMSPPHRGEWRKPENNYILIIRVQVSSHLEPWHPMQRMDMPVMMNVQPGHFRCLLQS